MIQTPFHLFIAMTCTVAMAYFLAAHWRFAQRFGVVQMAICFGLLCGNLGLLYGSDVGLVTQNPDVYGPLMGKLIPISIALLLFRLDFRELRNLRGSIFFYYFVGAIGTILGTIVAVILFGDKIGIDAARLGGQLSASYVGGGENAVAVAEAIGLREDNFNLFSAAFASDNVLTALWMMVALSAPFGFSRFFSSEIDPEQIEAAKEHTKPFGASEFLPSCFYSLALSGLIVWLSGVIAAPVRAVAQSTGWQWLDFNTSIIWVTTLALIVAQTRLRHALKVAYSLGMLFFLYFFFYMGAISSIAEIVRLGPTVFVFTATIVAIHGAVILGVGWLRKGDMATIFIASQCNIGGPGTAVALAEANGWQHMIVPSILLGVLGYAIGNYVGIMLAQVVLPMLV